MAVKTAMNQLEGENAQGDPGKKGWACNYYGKEEMWKSHISGGIALRHLSCLWLSGL